MNIHLIQGSEKHLTDCEDALRNSELGRQYFTSEGSARHAVEEGINAGTLYVALLNDEFAGFVYYIPKGIFHSFPYIHLLVVSPSQRGGGIGSQLLKMTERMASSKKIFLVVADFNPDGKRFYEKNGYVQVGRIDSLYRPDITEYLMMKDCEGE